MSWATNHIMKLDKGQTVSFRPRGNSMTPRINSGDLVTVSPDISKLEKGDVVLCKIRGYVLLHLISAIKGDQYQISNNHGHVNGWVSKKNIYGKLIDVNP